MARKRVLITGAAGYLSRQLLPVFRERTRPAVNTGAPRQWLEYSRHAIWRVTTSNAIRSTWLITCFASPRRKASLAS